MTPWRPTLAARRRRLKPVLGLEPFTCYLLSGVGSALTSSLMIQVWEEPRRGTFLPALLAWGAVWVPLGGALGYGKRRPHVSHGIWLGSLGGTVVAIVADLILEAV